MERRLRGEEVVTIEALHERGVRNRAIARQLGVHENAVRYRLRRRAAGARDGRAEKPFSAERFSKAIGLFLREAETPGGDPSGFFRGARAESLAGEFLPLDDDSSE